VTQPEPGGAMGEGEMDEQEALTLLRTSLWLRQKLILENPV